MKAAVITGIAALFLATGTAHATENFDVRCAGKLFNIYGHHGYSFSQYYQYYDEDKKYTKEISERLFHFKDKRGELSPYPSRKWFYRGHKCKVVKEFK
jgi:hypothetical protein